MQYLNLYKGNWIIIVGPTAKVDIYTDPLPLEPNLPNDALTIWEQRAYLALGEYDAFVIYEKKCLKHK